MLQVFSMPSSFLRLALCAALVVLSPLSEAVAQSGNLFVSPQRLELDQRKKTSQLHLVNKSSEVKSYEISVKNYAMSTEGRLGSEVETMPFSAKKYIRFSPRRVTLQPGEGQYVRVMLRLPKGLEDGGYHSHIEFTEIENANNRSGSDGADEKDAQVSFKVGASYGVAIPVFVNMGQVNASLSLGDISTEIRKGQNTGKAVINLQRQGNSSAQKKLTVHYVDAQGNAHLAITPTNISVYREIDYINREFQLRLPKGKVFGAGQLKVSLSEIDTKKTLDETTVSIK